MFHGSNHHLMGHSCEAVCLIQRQDQNDVVLPFLVVPLACTILRHCKTSKKTNVGYTVKGWTISVEKKTQYIVFFFCHPTSSTFACDRVVFTTCSD